MVGEAHGDRTPMVAVDLQFLRRMLHGASARVPYDGEPMLFSRGEDPETERHLQEDQIWQHENAVRKETDEAIIQLFCRERWPRTQSTIAWAAHRRFDWLEVRLREWSAIPSPLAMAVPAESGVTVASACIPLLTVYYTRQRGMS